VSFVEEVLPVKQGLKRSFEL